MAAIATGILSDGRTQVWLIEGNRIQSRWKVDVDPSAAWTGWSSFPVPEGATPAAISAAQLEDGRLQLYLADGQGRAWSAWKTSTDASASWTPWTPF
jgi:hypothetical protein